MSTGDNSHELGRLRRVKVLKFEYLCLVLIVIFIIVSEFHCPRLGQCFRTHVELENFDGYNSFFSVIYWSLLAVLTCFILLTSRILIILNHIANKLFDSEHLVVTKVIAGTLFFSPQIAIFGSFVAGKVSSEINAVTMVDASFTPLSYAILFPFFILKEIFFALYFLYYPALFLGIFIAMLIAIYMVYDKCLNAKIKERPALYCFFIEEKHLDAGTNLTKSLKKLWWYFYIRNTYVFSFAINLFVLLIAFTISHSNFVAVNDEERAKIISVLVYNVDFNKRTVCRGSNNEYPSLKLWPGWALYMKPSKDTTNNRSVATADFVLEMCVPKS